MALMSKLIGKVTDTIWRVLYEYYESSTAYVSKKENISPMFITTVGVKQGGPLSPRLFSIYVEDFIYELHSTNLGKKVNEIKTGIMYADDSCNE